MRGRFQLGEARSTCWSSELAEGGRGAVGFTQQPARSKQQLVSFALHRCCFICFVCLFHRGKTALGIWRESWRALGFGSGPGTALGRHLGVQGPRGGP